MAPTSRVRPRVAIVSVTYNRCEPLLLLLTQVRALDYPPDCLDIFLLDNASTDDTVERVQAGFPEVRIIRGATNTGISAGFNRSMCEALKADRDYKYLWLLDSDAEVEVSTLAPMVEGMEQDERIGIVGSAIYDPHDRERLVTSGLRMDWKRDQMPVLWPHRLPTDKLADVELIPACSLLVRSRLCRDLGLWDERFPLYWGDTDWCARMLHAGHRVCCSGASRAWHRDWASVQRGFAAPNFLRDHLQGALLFNLRHNPHGSSVTAQRLLLRSYWRAAAEHLTMRPEFAWACEQAVSDVLGGRFRSVEPAALPPFPRPAPIEEICDSLKARLPLRPSVMLHAIDDTTRRNRVVKAFEDTFGSIRLIVGPSADDGGQSLAWTEFRPIRLQLVPRLLSRMARYVVRPDVSVFDISRPDLSAVASARFTIRLDATSQGRVDRNYLWSGLWGCAATAVQGLRIAYHELPRALKSCAQLRDAVLEINGPSTTVEP